MNSVKRFGYTVLLAILAALEVVCVLWVLSLCGAAYEALALEQGSAPLGQYLSRLASDGDFWRALAFFLVNSLAFVGMVLLLRRERERRRAEIESQKLCENETEWEQQP